MLQLLIDIFNSNALSPIITILAFMWLHRDIKELKTHVGALTERVNKLADKVSHIDNRLARVEGILEVLRPRPAEADA